MSQAYASFGAGLSNLLPFRPRTHPKPAPLQIDTSPSALETQAPAASEQATTPKAELTDITPRHPTPSRFPEYLHFDPASLRGRSPSLNSSILSGTLPDSSSATFSYSSLVSPISTSYASEVQEMLSGSRPSSRMWHRHKPSSGSDSTLMDVIEDDEEDSFRGLQIGPFPWDSQEEELEIGSNASDGPVDEGAEHDFPSTQSENTSRALDDVGSERSDDFHPEDAESIVDYTLQLVYGVEMRETSIAPGTAHQLVQRFVQDISHHVWRSPSDGNDSQGEQRQSTSSGSACSSPSSGNNSHSSYRAGEKRKKLGSGDGEGDEFSDGEGGSEIRFKKQKPTLVEENLRLSCPYRKRNPHRFNVRDHHSCAMTYFPKFAELRQHIVKQHKRDDPSAFVCDRCNRDFISRKDLRDHQRLPKEQMCDISDHDPESGIDGPTSNKLLSRKRASGPSAEVQWREIWNILFPDDDDHSIHPYHFVPVIEHFELETHYMAAFQSLHASLLDKISNPATLETLTNKFKQCFIETVDRCTIAAQDMPYTNRSNKRNEPAKGHSVLSSQRLSAAYARDTDPPGMQDLMQRNILPRPDSGVVIDDGSEESGSTTGQSLTHKDSVRTVRGGYGGEPIEVAGNTKPTIRPTSPSHFFDESLYPGGDPSSGLAMEAMAVPYWSDTSMGPQVGNGGGEEVDSHFEDSFMTTVGPQFSGEGMNWAEMYQTNFTGMGEGFTGFHGK